MSMWEGRKRLDATLSSYALKDSASILEITRNHLTRSPPFDLPVQRSEEWANKDVNQEAQKHSHEVVKFLEVLRSAGGEKTQKLSLLDEAGDSSHSWKLKQENASMRVMYRKGPEGTPFHTYCVEGTIDGPMVNALCVSWEAPSYKDWWPQTAVPSFKVVVSQWLQRIRVGEDVSLIRVKVPWPLANREVLMTAFEWEYLEEDLILVILGTLSTSSQALDDNNVVRMDIAGGYVLQKMTPNTSYFRTVLDVDIKLDFVPPWIINFISRQLVGLGYKLYQKAVLSINTGNSNSKLLMEKEPLYSRLKGLNSSHAFSQMVSSMRPLLNGEGPASSGEINKETLLQGDGEVVSPALHDIVSSIPPKGFYASSLPNESLDPAGHVGVRVENKPREAVQADDFRDPEVRRALISLDKMIAIVRSLTKDVESGRVIYTGKPEVHLPSEQFVSIGADVHANYHLKPLEKQTGMNGHLMDARNDIAADSVSKPELGISNKKHQLPKWLSCFKF